MECSDECGCSFQCPRRQLQRGSQKDFVVSYECSEKEFGLRAPQKYKMGQLITEYTGVLKLINDQDDTSYQAAVSLFDEDLTIDASEFGNVGRFPSHNCHPNVALIQVYSRIYKTDPMLPRIALYAIEDIPLARELCASYYTRDALKKAKKSKKGVPCLCNFEECYKHLPI